MKTLEEHNEERRKFIDALLKADKSLNDIECPQCGMELYDTNVHMMLTSDPPQRNIHCENCSYTGLRLA